MRAFGVNAWTGDEGDELIGAHDESSSGHEELYLVVEGNATFTVADETFAAPVGTVVFVRDRGFAAALWPLLQGRRSSPSARSRASRTRRQRGR